MPALRPAIPAEAEAARAAAETVARASYGRLVAFLAARFRDLAGAEDALADSLRAALEAWPRDGVPDRPEAWLLTAARRRLVDAKRRARTRDDGVATLEMLAEAEQRMERPDFPDERLKLLFICAHPAIDPAARTPLMLQTVLGLDAARIAGAFLLAPSTMSQRLVRAKARIKAAGIPFRTPEPEELPERLHAVLEAVYAAYGTGWEDADGSDPRRRGLAEEALFLARLTVDLLPDEPEAMGLYALLLHCEARRAARRDAAGRYVPLSDQDPALWRRELIGAAEAMLNRAAEHRRLGPFQIEAGIQSVHAFRAVSGRTDWGHIAALYRILLAIAPTIGARIGFAAALAEEEGPEQALAELDGIDPSQVAAHQPYWAVRAHLLARLGRIDEAGPAYTRAIGLAEDQAVRAFLQERLQRLI